MQHILKSALAVTLLATAACGSTNNALSSRSETFEDYHIIDVKYAGEPNSLFAAVENGAKRHSSSYSASRPLVVSGVPEEPGRFEIVNPLGNTDFGGLAALAGPQATAQFKTATCEGATYVGQAQRQAGNMQSMKATVCLYPYTDGYSMQVYSVNTVKNGGGVEGLIQRGVEGAIGDGEVWGRRLVDGLVAAVQQHPGTEVSYTEGTGGISLAQ